MISVLLLNATYEPLAVIPQRRAMSLLLRGGVDPATDEIIHVPGITSAMSIPTVIRLRRYVKAPRRGVRWSRRDRRRGVSTYKRPSPALPAKTSVPLPQIWPLAHSSGHPEPIPVAKLVAQAVAVGV